MPVLDEVEVLDQQVPTQRSVAEQAANVLERVGAYLASFGSRSRVAAGTAGMAVLAQLYVGMSHRVVSIRS